MKKIYSLLIFVLALGFGAKAQNSVHVQVYVVDMNNQSVPFWQVYFNAYGDQNFNINSVLGTNGNGIIDTTFSYPSGLNDLFIFVSTRGCDGSWAGVGDTIFNPSGTYTYTDTLVINCPATPNCSLSFTHSSTTSQPATVSFSPSGQGPSGATGLWSVDFGDGTSQVYGSAPFTHTYSQTGQYQVCMSITYADTNLGITYCTVTYCDSVSVNSTTPVYNCSGQINASKSPTGSNPYRVWIQYQTSYGSIPPGGSLTRTINYGDGTSATASSSGSMYHTYSSPGPYFPSISVILKDANNTIVCSSFDQDSIYFSPPASTGCSAQVNVSQNTNTYLGINANATGSTVQNLPSGGYVRYYYSFGGSFSGPYASASANTYHGYSQPGLKTVCVMQVAFGPNNDTLCVSYDCDSINVTSPYNCQASFTLDTANSGNGTVYLWNTSTWDSGITNVDQWWDFGDGDTAWGAFPTHIYNSPGSYAVCLYLYTSGPAGVCQSYFCDTLTVDSAGNVVFKNGSFTLIVRDPATIGLDEDVISTMSMYPNPADQYVTVEGAGTGDLNWQLIDVKGMVIGRGVQHINGNESFTIDVSAYARGIYILRLENGKTAEHHKLKLDR